MLVVPLTSALTSRLKDGGLGILIGNRDLGSWTTDVSDLLPQVLRAPPKASTFFLCPGKHRSPLLRVPVFFPDHCPRRRLVHHHCR